MSPTTETEIVDLRAIEYGGHTAAEWKAVIDAMDSGDPVLVSDSIADYFLNVLPPRAIFAAGFTFAEGEDSPTVFLRTGRRGDPWLAQRGSAPDLRDRLRRLLPHVRP
ncbi:MAG TPA: hypothetical protein VFR81_00185 [Longimicrobium sp.]|nr:hypothetical protein [Longimicrobium sp.]